MTINYIASPDTPYCYGAGTPVDMFAYDSYGYTDEGTGIPFKYTGRYYDAETVIREPKKKDIEK